MSDRTHIPRDEWEWYGNAGHFIGSNRCRFHLTTAVGKVVVSTVGEYFPARGGEMEELGVDRKYETMVFVFEDRCDKGCGGCGLPVPLTYIAEETNGYNTAGDATRGHLAMCEKWATDQQALLMTCGNERCPHATKIAEAMARGEMAWLVVDGKMFCCSGCSEAAEGLGS